MLPLQTLRERAYRQIRMKLVAGDFPAGTAVSETVLAKELGMSRTPVREAIRQMEVEGLLRYVPRYGAMVRIPDRGELDEMYEVRSLLECRAAELAAERISDADLEELGRLLQKMQEVTGAFLGSGEEILAADELREFLAADLGFHRTIVRSCGNRYLARILDGAQLLVHVFRSTAWRYNAESLAEANGFHTRLLKGLQSREPSVARQCTVEALEVSRKNALAQWDRNQGNVAVDLEDY